MVGEVLIFRTRQRCRVMDDERRVRWLTFSLHPRLSVRRSASRFAPNFFVPLNPYRALRSIALRPQGRVRSDGNRGEVEKSCLFMSLQLRRSNYIALCQEKLFSFRMDENCLSFWPSPVFPAPNPCAASTFCLVESWQARRGVDRGSTRRGGGGSVLRDSATAIIIMIIVFHSFAGLVSLAALQSVHRPTVLPIFG